VYLINKSFILIPVQLMHEKLPVSVALVLHNSFWTSGW